MMLVIMPADTTGSRHLGFRGLVACLLGGGPELRLLGALDLWIRVWAGFRAYLEGQGT